MSNVALRHWLERSPFVAILRGVAPAEALPIADALYAEGWRIIEVPLDTPQALDCVSRLQRHFEGHALVGAGTVRRHDELAKLVDTGAKLMSCPHADPGLIAAALASGLVALPGGATPTECLQALAVGADGIKLFPARAVGVVMLQALDTVLPPHTLVLPAGGIQPDNLEPWMRAGADGFCVGGSLYRPGATPAQVRQTARRFNDAWHALRDAEAVG